MPSANSVYTTGHTGVVLQWGFCKEVFGIGNEMLLMGQHSMSRCGAGHSVLLFNEGWGIINLPFKNFQGFTRFACHMVLKKTSKVTITSGDETNYVFSMFFKFFRSSYCLLLCLLKNKSCKNQCPKHTFQTNSILVQKSGQLCGNSEENYFLHFNKNVAYTLSLWYSKFCQMTNLVSLHQNVALGLIFVGI